MNIDHLEDLLGKWAADMKHSDSHKLGYPSKSIGLSGGGASTSFDDLFDTMTGTHVRTIDAIIHSLEPRQQNAIYAKWLGAKPEELQNYHYNLAIDNLLTIASRRISV